ncbi:hypothetical protein ACIBG8_52580 [Nonomuraea sp. NPDC050556]|uniref:hypothetical protein n=1 Tax=Nonomuraea sp. NPDC050556 TaxID=3364369 RepID=UPI0037BC6FD2
MAGRVCALVCALIVSAATLFAAPAQAAGPVLHRDVYRYAYGYQLDLTIAGNNRGRAYAWCAINNAPVYMKIHSCQLLRYGHPGAGTQGGSDWSLRPVAWSRLISLTCGTSYRVFIRFQGQDRPIAKAYGTWWKLRCL